MMPLEYIPEDDPILKRVAKEGEPYRWGTLAHRISNLALATGALGVAAPQVGVSVRLVALPDGTAVLNPIVTPIGDEKNILLEGCMSLPPDDFYWVPRYLRVHVSGVTPDNNEPVEFDTEGIEARMWQHEQDHLNGLLLNDGRFKLREKM